MNTKFKLTGLGILLGLLSCNAFATDSCPKDAFRLSDQVKIIESGVDNPISDETDILSGTIYASLMAQVSQSVIRITDSDCGTLGAMPNGTIKGNRGKIDAELPKGLLDAVTDFEVITAWEGSAFQGKLDLSSYPVQLKGNHLSAHVLSCGVSGRDLELTHAVQLSFGSKEKTWSLTDALLLGAMAVKNKSDFSLKDCDTVVLSLSNGKLTGDKTMVESVTNISRLMGLVSRSATADNSQVKKTN